jgi:hypothetical protein
LRFPTELPGPSITNRPLTRGCSKLPVQTSFRRSMMKPAGSWMMVPPPAPLWEDWFSRPSVYSTGPWVPLTETSKRVNSGSVWWILNSGRHEYWPLMPPARTMMLATWPDRPGMRRLAPSTISSRMTLPAGIRLSCEMMSSDLPEMRWPLSSTFPVAWPSPRSTTASRITKPGTCRSMSSAVRGA